MTQDNLPDRIYATGGPTSGSWNKERINPRVAPPQTTLLKATPAREAAEDMLDALEDVLKYLENDMIAEHMAHPERRKVRAAIARAKGENT